MFEVTVAENSGQVETELMKITKFDIFNMPMSFFTYGQNGQLESNVILTAETAGRIKEFEGITERLNIFILKDGVPHPITKESLLAGEADRAMRGGIDFNSDKVESAFSVRNSGGEIKFHIDPAMLEQLQNAPGFMPVIINIQPMTDVRLFLGLTDNQPTQQVASI